MIGKKISNPKHSASKSARIHYLLDYIRNPEKNGREKAVYIGARGFLSRDERVQKQEMKSLAHASARSKDPINHYVFSWKEGEEPSPEQVERAVEITLNELGMKVHQAAYALHADTNHYHLHLVVNRVRPETEKVASARNDYESIHRAVARIEHEQGWERERRGRYRVSSGSIERSTNRPPKEQSLHPRSLDREARTGEKSAERIAQERGARVMGRARTWRELHERLGQEGLRYERKGSGAVLFVGAVPVKASLVGREFSFEALQKRLGPFVEREAGQRVHQRPPEPLGPSRASQRVQELSPLRSKNHLRGEVEQKPKERTLRDFTAQTVRNEVRYSRPDETRPAFVDRTKRVDLYSPQDKDALRAALQLAAEKWGSVSVQGKKEFIDLVVVQAAVLNIRLTQPELQARVEAERARTRIQEHPLRAPERVKKRQLDIEH